MIRQSIIKNKTPISQIKRQIHSDSTFLAVLDNP